MKRLRKCAVAQPRARQTRRESDYVIVGGGTAGCVLANRLSKDGTKKVTLLEAGGDDSWVWLKIPIGYLFAMMNKRVDWCFATTPQGHLNGRRIAMPRGKVLGGCSSINGTIYMRGQRRDYDEWAVANPGWSWDDVLPYFKGNMDYYRGADALHGAGGEWAVSAPRVHWEVLDVFQRAAAENGIPVTDHFNTSDEQACGYFQVTHRRGVRCSASTAFLHPILHRRNLNVVKHALTRRLIIEGGRCLGVEYEDAKSKNVREIFGKEVILAAGSINSPHLLQLSGVGPRALLEKHGVAVVRDAAGVGGNLHDHLQIRPAFRLKDGTTTLNQLTKSYLQMVWMGVQYAASRSGPLAMAPSQFGAVARSSPGEATPDLEFHVQPLSCTRLELGDLDDFPGVTLSVCNLRPTSRGTVALSGNSVHSPPTIDPNYLSTPDDQLKAVLGIRLARTLISSPAFAHLAPVEVRPGPAEQTDQELVAAAADIASSIFHPVGTCKMGPASDPGAVVDSRLRVHSVERLRVVDCSVMPSIPSGNTCSPVVMLAEKAADMIKEDTLKLAHA
ncbi:alcohol dehydrogenase [Diplonema papillatum]|nr:alcohol dehydrogenase [Diplonema papillatum]